LIIIDIIILHYVLLLLLLLCLIIISHDYHTDAVTHCIGESQCKRRHLIWIGKDNGCVQSGSVHRHVSVPPAPTDPAAVFSYIRGVVNKF